jgi:apolipoprotein N-acyltransferase
MTAIIDPHGRVTAQLAQFTEGVLSGEAQGYAGATPYVWLGNRPVVILCIAMIGALIFHRRRALRPPRESR